MEVLEPKRTLPIMPTRRATRRPSSANAGTFPVLKEPQAAPSSHFSSHVQYPRRPHSASQKKEATFKQPHGALQCALAFQQSPMPASVRDSSISFCDESWSADQLADEFLENCSVKTDTPSEATTVRVAVNRIVRLRHKGWSRLSPACQELNAAIKMHDIAELQVEADKPDCDQQGSPKAPPDLRMTIAEIMAQITSITSGELVPHLQSSRVEGVKSPKARTEEERAAAMHQLRQKQNLVVLGTEKCAQDYIQEKVATLRSDLALQSMFRQSVNSMQIRKLRNKTQLQRHDFHQENIQLAALSQQEREHGMQEHFRQAEVRRAQVHHRRAKLQEQLKDECSARREIVAPLEIASDPPLIVIRQQKRLLTLLCAAYFGSEVAVVMKHNRIWSRTWGVLKCLFAPCVRQWLRHKLVASVQQFSRFLLHFHLTVRIKRKQYAVKRVVYILRRLRTSCVTAGVLKGYRTKVVFLQRQIRQFLMQRKAQKQMLTVLWENTEQKLYTEHQITELQDLRMQLRKASKSTGNVSASSARLLERDQHRLGQYCKQRVLLQAHQRPLSAMAKSGASGLTGGQRYELPRDPANNMPISRKGHQKLQQQLDSQKTVSPLASLAAMGAHELPDRELRDIAEEAGLLLKHKVFFVPDDIKNQFIRRAFQVRFHFYCFQRAVQSADDGRGPRYRYKHTVPLTKVDQLSNLSLSNAMTRAVQQTWFMFLFPASEARALVTAAQELYETRRRRDFESRMTQGQHSIDMTEREVEAEYNSIILRIYTPLFIGAYQQGANINTTMKYMRRWLGYIDDATFATLQKALLANPPPPDQAPPKSTHPWITLPTHRAPKAKAGLLSRKAVVQPPAEHEIALHLDLNPSFTLPIDDDLQNSSPLFPSET